MNIKLSLKDKRSIDKETLMNGLFAGASVLAAGSILLYTKNDLQHLDFILRPVSSLVYWTTGSASSYLEETGYVHETLGISIGASCSGIHFLTVLFLMLVFNFISKVKGLYHKIATFIIFGILAICITILANASRILVSVLVLSLPPFSTSGQGPLIHLAIGVLFYFSYLLLTYSLASAIYLNKGAHSYETSV